MSSTSNPRVQLIDSQGDPMDSAGDNALKVKLVDTDVEITVDASELSVHLEAANDDVLVYGYDYSSGNSKLKVDSNGLLYIKSISDAVTVNTISGFATEVKQPSLGTAGSASANVITVQGIASMTPLVVDLGTNNDVTIGAAVEVVQDTPADLTATVTQASSARTVTCDTAGNLLATVTQASDARTKAIAGTSDTGHQASIGSSSTEIVDILADRMAILIVNDSDETIYLMLGGVAVANRGIRINANGGSFYTEIWRGAINGICASGSKNVTVTEVSP